MADEFPFDKSIHIHHPVPIFRVENLAVSLDYYTRVLGFEIGWQLPW